MEVNEEPRYKPTDPEFINRVTDLCLQQIQLDKGMPILQPLDPDLERLIIGKDE